MFNNVTLGQYFPGDTFIHNLDPRTKILLTIFLVVIVFANTSFLAYALLFILFLSIVVIAKLSVVRLIKSVKPLWPIILITFLVHMFTREGTVLYTIMFLNITLEGLQQGLLIVIRLVFLILFSSVMTMTTSPLELTDGIELLLKPFKKIGLPAHELAMMMTIALRFIPTLLGETERIMMAQTARGMDFKKGSLVKRGKNILALIVPLFLSAFRRADELAIAMEARCYRGGEGRTRMKRLSFSKLDVIAVIIVCVFGTAIFYAKWSS